MKTNDTTTTHNATCEKANDIIRPMIEALLKAIDSYLPPEKQLANRKELSRESGNAIKELLKPHLKPMLQRFLAETDHPALTELRTLEIDEQHTLLSFEINRSAWEVMPEVMPD